MNVQDGMSSVVLSIGPTHTLRDAARMMSARHVGAALGVGARTVALSLGDGLRWLPAMPGSFIPVARAG